MQRKPIHFAVLAGSFKVVEYLLNCGKEKAGINAKDNNGVNFCQYSKTHYELKQILNLFGSLETTFFFFILENPAL